MPRLCAVSVPYFIEKYLSNAMLLNICNQRSNMTAEKKTTNLELKTNVPNQSVLSGAEPSITQNQSSLNWVCTSFLVLLINKLFAYKFNLHRLYWRYLVRTIYYYVWYKNNFDYMVILLYVCNLYQFMT